MKKVLQRIGVLALAVMLLWGYQGSGVKAAESKTIGMKAEVTSEGSAISSTDATDSFLFYLTAENGYDFQKAWEDGDLTFTFHKLGGGELIVNNLFTAEVKTDPVDSQRARVLVKWKDAPVRGEYTYAVEARLSSTGDRCSQMFFSYDIKVISTVDITVEAPVVGQPLPKYWKVEQEDALNEFCQTRNLMWLKQGDKVTEVTGQNAEAGATYKAVVTLSLGSGYRFNRDTWQINTTPNTPYSSIGLGYSAQVLVINYYFTLADDGSVITPTTPSENPTDPTPNTDNTDSSSDNNDPDYQIISGANSSWTGNEYSANGLTITGDGEYSKFAGVRVDGNWIPSVHYEVSEGSTIVTLKPSYLASLSAGEHTAEIMWIDGSAATTMTINVTAVQSSELDNVPKTGEMFGWMPAVLAALAVICCAGGVVTLKRTKRN